MILTSESLLLLLIAELLSKTISTAPSEMFLYQTNASMMVSPAMIPPSLLLYANWCSFVPVIKSPPSTYWAFSLISVGAKIIVNVPAGPIGEIGLKDTLLQLQAMLLIIPLAKSLHLSSMMVNLSKRMVGLFTDAVRPLFILFHSMFKMYGDGISS